MTSSSLPTRRLRRLMGAAAVGLALCAGLAPAGAAGAPAPIVFFDIAGPDMATQRAFYSEVFGWTASPQGGLSVPAVAPLPGVLRADPAQKVIYLGVPDVAAALQQVTAHGGAVLTPRFEVKGVAVIGLFKDPAGNGMGVVELGADGRPKIP